ncbi:MAG: bifunctional YncE family protein/alkaline phosphatase family protein [Bryobacteraceae bacterium]|nr:bifunctional YncE family protein/alkaline phosphatase family protein [Bryobacteraceae bacterium]
MKRHMIIVMAFVIGAGVLYSQRERLWPAGKAAPGPNADGGFLLPTGWTVRPAGRQIALNTLPLAARLVDGGKSMLILQSGYKTPGLSLHESASGKLLASVEFKDSFHGLAVWGDMAYVGGGTTAQVYKVRMTAGGLEAAGTFPAVAAPASGGNFTADIAISSDGKTLYAADMLTNTIAVIERSSGALQRTIDTVRMPYRLLLHPKRDELLVTSWSGGEVARHELASGKIAQRLPAGSHSSDMIWQTRADGLRLIVAASHTNEVSIFAAGADGELRAAEKLNISLMPQQPPGMTPSALALNENGKRLYIACSDANALAVADVSGARARVLGFVPTGWYPTGVVPLSGGKLAVLNGKGLRSFPNPAAPRKPEEQKQTFQHGGQLQMGGLSLIEPFDGKQLVSYSRQVLSNSPYRDHLLGDAGVPAGNPVPTRIGQPSPIRNVIYIVKENRTYDQVFGDLKQGNGDPSLVLFSEDSSINHRKLAAEFGLFDNFYVNGDVSADGHNWSAGAIAPDMTNKLWPNLYSGRGAKFSLYWGRPPVNHTEDASRPHGGYLWTRAFEAGLTVRNYGWMTKLRQEARTGEDQVVDAESKQLLEATNRYFRPYDVRYPDVDRMEFFLRDLAEFERKGEMPRLIVMRLGNDHTAGLSPGAYSPRAMFADNDLAMGRLVEAVSKSRFWKQTAIFVLEDDAQAGPDHVDSHRSIALVISPYARRKHLDSNFYNTVSMLRTMELILGLRPMTHFDAAAMPMHTAFTATPDLTPYAAEMPRVSRTEKNPARGTLAARSQQMDFEDADRIDDQEMNDILYRAIQGRPAPPPVRSAFNPTADSLP